MGYYDFDDHFWSPQEVCGKSPRQKLNQKTSLARILGKVYKRAVNLLKTRRAR